MSIVALTNALTSQVWQRRFHADPLVRSAELLLHERIPRRLVCRSRRERDADDALPEAETERPAVREFETPDTPQPHVGTAGPLAVHHHGESLRRGIQPLRGTRRDAVARRRYTGRDRAVLLREGRLDWTGLVRGPPADVRACRLVQRLSRDRSRHLPSRRR